MNDRPTVRPAGPRASEAAGTILGGRYTIERLIARGGMATVYLANDHLLNRPVAVKVLTGDADGREQDSFLREARAVAQLSHPNIVEVYDAGIEGSLRYIVMQYVPGGTLRDVLARDAPLEPNRAVDLTIRLADALEFGHGRGVVHCDVKPGNVLLNDGGEPKIVDFGIARTITHTADITETIAGTAGYISPEQIEGEPLDGRADLYSLAAVLYEMLTGAPPHSGGSLASVMAQRLVRPPDLPSMKSPTVPQALDRIVMRALEREPTNRYASAREFADDLRAYRSGSLDDRTHRARRATPEAGRTERITANRRTPPAAIATPREQPRSPWLFLTVAGTLAAVITALFVVLGMNLLGDGGSVQVAVPPVGGARLDDAAPRIREAGLRVGKVEFVRDAAPLGTVLSQQPAPSSRVDRGGTVTLTVSSGDTAP